MQLASAPGTPCVRLDGSRLVSPACALCADPEGELEDVHMAPCDGDGSDCWAAVLEGAAVKDLADK